MAQPHVPDIDEALMSKDFPDSSADPWFRRTPNCVRVVEADGLAQSVANCIVELIGEVLLRRSTAIITSSTGRTLQPIYATLRDAHRTSLDWSRVVCVQMDEYAGVGIADARSTAAELQREFVLPLGIKSFVRFYDSAGVAHHSFSELEQQIDALGGIDCAIHGVGTNGHIGFNEPAITEDLGTRIVQLAESTRTANKVAFVQGVTLGLDILRKARVSVVVLKGSSKRNAAKALLFDPVGPHNPVGYLRSCNRVSIFLDLDAAPDALIQARGLSRERHSTRDCESG